MPLVNFSNLDFTQIKESIREYVKANSNFTDYDFEGSNLSAIIDILAYNTYINSYNANMVSNEVFLDSATLRENVVALARNIGFVPRSRKASSTEVTFSVDVSGLSNAPATLTLKRGLVATTLRRFGNLNYTFTVPDDITVPVVNDVATFNKIEIYEGTPLKADFVVDSSNTQQKFIINNSDVDTSLIRVEVYDTKTSSTKRNFHLKEDLFNVNSDSNVFFIQETADEQYELIFGDGVFGTKLENSNYIVAYYSTTSGPEANNVSQFSFAGRLIDNSGTVVTSDISTLSPVNPTSGGQDIESVSSIKKFAPRVYSAQNRAVTAADYEAIVPRIYAEAESVVAYGGETLDPPRFGEIFLSIKPTNGNFVPSTIKNNIISDLSKYSVASIRVNILDLKFLFIEYQTSVYYNSNLVGGPETVKSSVSTNIEKYADSSELNKFGSRLKYSKLLGIIDNSHDSIVSNITNLEIRRDMKPLFNQFTEYEVCYGNALFVRDRNGYNVRSSGFRVSGIAETLYLSDKPNADLKTGSIFLFRLNSDLEPVRVAGNVGTIDYVKGEILLTSINIISTVVTDPDQVIQISVPPASNDVIGKQDLYIQLDNSNSTITTIVDPISSGSDVSGSSYKSSQSYFSNTSSPLIRS
tara:strand:- start:274 stop:2190 length:1917 start_codon:yes stop_codon:yes gene_type:complete